MTSKEGAIASDVSQHDVEHGQSSVHKGWMYRRLRIGSWKSTYYASPLTQVLIVSFICFLDSGMSNALSGLGGGGQLNAYVADVATCAVYATFAFFAFFSGSICNKIGVKWMLVMGGFGYAVSCSSYICYNHTQNQGFVIFGGALAGVCAAFLWTAQGTVVMSYPSEQKKGKYVAINWAIFNMGAVLGALIPLGESLDNSSGTVNDGTYIAFTVLMFFGSVVGFAMIDTDKVIREDGSKIILMKHPSWKSEFTAMWKVLFTDSFIILLFPMFFSSNWFYTYQFNDWNLARFTIRTRCLNNVIYWTMQILGSFCFGLFLDWERFSRHVRARVCWVVLLVFTVVIWGSGLKYQLGWARSEVKAEAADRIDWTDNAWGGMFVLYIFWGFFDVAWQTSVYWFMGSLSNSSRKLAIYAGLYKSLQSAANAIVWRLDSIETSYAAMFGSSWGLLMGGLVFALPVVWFKIKDHTAVTQDLDFSDETVADVQQDEKL